MITDNQGNSNKIITGITGVLLIGSTIYLTITMGANDRLSNNLRKEKLNAEILLSEKLSIEKRIEKFKKELKSLEEKNTGLELLVGSTNKRLAQNEAELRAAQKVVASDVQLKKLNQELKTLKDDLEQEVLKYKNALTALQNSNDEMMQRNALLQQHNKDIAEGLNILQLTSMNDILIEPTKQNNRLTISAKKTKNLSINLNLSMAAENLKFKILDPSGNELTTNDQNPTVKVTSTSESKSDAFYAALNKNTSTVQNDYKKVQVIYKPENKLKPGTYTIFITNDGLSIGSLQVRLK